MNKNNSNGFLKSKGFYYALYLSLAAFLVLIVVVSFSSLNRGRNSGTTLSAIDERLNQAYISGDATQRSTPQRSQTSETPSGVLPVIPPPTVTERPTQQHAYATPPAYVQNEINRQIAENERMAERAAQLQEARNETNNEAMQVTSINLLELPDGSLGEIASADGMGTVVYAEIEEPAEYVFAGFDSASTMIWPVVGEVLMGFSGDMLVYNPTLEHFRTNTSLSIASDAGTRVRSSADGIVSSVGHNQILGHYIVIDNGNGWETTFSQLDEKITVRKGDFVKQGQTIGEIAAPSIFSIMLGDHLEFMVSYNGSPVDPKRYLE
jgi:murein DD-endopeptidase MepM/ murein hydrolase activator NlpD